MLNVGNVYCNGYGVVVGCFFGILWGSEIVGYSDC